jgi:hypothetical protein
MPFPGGCLKIPATVSGFGVSFAYPARTLAHNHLSFAKLEFAFHRVYNEIIAGFGESLKFDEQFIIFVG